MLEGIPTAVLDTEVDGWMMMAVAMLSEVAVSVPVGTMEKTGDDDLVVADPGDSALVAVVTIEKPDEVDTVVEAPVWIGGDTELVSVAVVPGPAGWE